MWPLSSLTSVLRRLVVRWGLGHDHAIVGGFALLIAASL